MPQIQRTSGIPNLGGLPAKALFYQPIYVSSTDVNASNDNAGTDPRFPLATIANAFSADKVAAYGVIVVMAAHAESVIAANGILCDIAGVHIFGLGEGSHRPTITFSTAVGADIEVDAASITFENLIFDATGVDALTGPLDIDAAGCTFRSCKFVTADSGGQATDVIVGDANADELTIEDCVFSGSTDAGSDSQIRLIGSADAVIRRNRMYGDCAAGNIEVITTAITNVLIEDNSITNLNAVDVCIELYAASTGIVRYNSLEIPTDGEVTWINTAGAVTLYENYGVNSDAETGMICGTVSTT